MSYLNIKSKINNHNLDINENNNSKVLLNKCYDYQKNKIFITTSYLYILFYIYTKNINLILIIIKYFTFAQNIFKYYVKIFHMLDFFIFSKIIHQSLKVNTTNILKIFLMWTIQ